MSVVVTGGAGFLGSHLVDRLIALGEDVVVLDNLLTGQIRNLESALRTGKAAFAYCDVAGSPDVMRTAIADAARDPVTEIYHLASPASPEAYGAHPWETLQVNSVGTMSLIDLALALNSKLLCTSTSEVYGDPLVHPQREDYFGNVNPVGPRACYDEGKRFAEAAMSVAIERRGLDGRIVRIFNCYGPRMDVEDGRLIPSIMQAAREGVPMTIHGDGSQTRSMTYVDDLISGLITVMKSNCKRPVNLGNETEFSVCEIADLVADIVGVKREVAFVAARPEDPRRRNPDVSLARSLGWSAQTPLSDGLRVTYAWLTSRSVEFV